MAPVRAFCVTSHLLRATSVHQAGAPNAWCTEVMSAVDFVFRGAIGIGLRGRPTHEEEQHGALQDTLVESKALSPTAR